MAEESGIGEKGNSGIKAALHTTFLLGGQTFFAVLGGSADGLLLSAGWQKSGNGLNLKTLFEHFSVELPDFLGFPLELNRASLAYLSRKKEIDLKLEVNHYGSMELGRRTEDGRSRYAIAFQLENRMNLNCLPLIGKEMAPDDCVGLSRIEGSYTGSGPQGQKGEVGLKLTVALSLGGTKLSPIMDFKRSRETVSTLPALSTAALPSASEIKWVDLKKDIKIIHFRKLGFAFKEGRVYLFLNCGATLSCLELEFIEFHVSFPIQWPPQPEFGLKGMAVSLSRPPFALMGGLYLDRASGLFNGEVAVTFQNFSLLAMGSYGTLPRSDRASFFLYLILSKPLGGPPCFYVTGLAGGFGIHRELRLPQLSGVKDFPLVAAACGRNAKLTSASNAAEALRALGEAVAPAEGRYFVCAGVHFTSFGMIDSFVLLTVEFGSRFQISLLGVSEVSLPPLKQNVTPIACASLNLRALFCPSEGILQVEAALGTDSYLFTRECRLSGGFAFYSWFSGEHSGDFVLSLGGYHPDFSRSHYPAVDRIGINWQIGRGLSMSGEAYFAMTPNCLMAGGRLEVLYKSGSLSAWCKAYANILMQWKPFHYSIEAGVSIGVSFRLDFWFIHKTFTLELSASLKIWGPEFSGSVRVKLFIISFTIHFGAESKNTAPVLDWSEFRDTFLLDRPGTAVETKERDEKCKAKTPDETGSLSWKPASSQTEEFWQISLKAGQLTAIRDGAENTDRGCDGDAEVGSENGADKPWLVDGQQVCMEIRGRIPCWEIYFNGKVAARCETPLGIVPMKCRSYQAVLEVRTVSAGGGVIKLQGEVLRENFPKALWNSSDPGMNEGMLTGIPSGLCITAPNQEPLTIPPQPENWYDVKRLTENQRLFSPNYYAWNAAAPALGKSFAGKNAVEEMERTLADNLVRRHYLEQLAGYGVMGEEQVSVEEYRTHLSTILWAPMILHTTAAEHWFDSELTRADDGEPACNDYGGERVIRQGNRADGAKERDGHVDDKKSDAKVWEEVFPWLKS